MLHSSFKRALVPLVCAAAAMPALATNVYVDQLWGYGYPTADLHYKTSTYSNEAVAGFVLTNQSTNQTFAGFCMKINQGVGTQSTTNYTITSYTNDAFSRLFAVSGFNGADRNNDGINSADKEAALQLALWEVLYDGFGGSLGSGNFWVNNVSSANTLTLAQSYLTSAAALQSGQYVTTTLQRYSNEWAQDLISSTAVSTAPVTPSVVPEPETAFMWLGGVAALAAWRRRQLKRARA